MNRAFLFCILKLLTVSREEFSVICQSDQLDDAHLCCIAPAGTGLDYTAIAAVYFLILGSDFVKQLLYNVLFGNVCKNSAL